ncbi:MAG TPA: formyl transferase [Gammaproteobacteria bacterium]|nr:formyl transferase [Gammaproteobacteria bacterium]
MSEKKIVFLASNNASSRMVFNQLKAVFPIEKAITEKKQNAWLLIKKRAKRLGWLTVFGQIAFMGYAKCLRRCSEQRINEIKQHFNLDLSNLPEDITIRVNSANDRETIQLLQQLQPDIVVINGTRLLSKELLASTDAVFINMHAGITPAYRGVHGGYWALANHDANHCGVTVHLVDEGIDTGNILYQSVIAPTPSDNFITYPLLQLAAGIPLLIQAVKDVQNNQIAIQPAKTNLDSKLRSHPTLWQYVYYRLRFGVK